MVAAQTYRTWTSGSITLAANETDTANVLLKKLNVAASHQSNSMISAVPGVQYSHGSLIFGSRINEATVSLFTLDGRELFHTSLPAGVNRIVLPNSLAGTGKALVVSVRGKDIALEQTIISGR
jgi:hypothetical protein